MSLKPRLHDAVAAAGLVIIAVLAYGPALRGGFVWDDHTIVDNSLLKDLRGLKAIWTDPASHPYEEHWWPILHTSFWIEYQLWGLNPFYYHLDNVLLHAANGVLIWLLLRGLNVPGAWVGAALFAVHPIHVESVAWVIERKDVLSGAFYLMAAQAFLRFDRHRSMGAYAASVAFFACAMLTKSIAMTLPVALVLYLWWQRTRGERRGLPPPSNAGESLRTKPNARDLVPVLPFVAVGALLEYVSLYVLGLPRLLDNAELDALPALAPVRWLIAGRALVFYAVKLLWPVNLMPVYPRWALDASPEAWAVTLIAIAVPIALWFARHRLGKGPLVAVLFFMVTLSPTLGLVNFGHMRYSFVADRFQYLASFGLIALAAAGGARMADRLWRGRAIATIILLVLGTFTWRQATIYQDEETFWRFAAARNPDAWVADYNLGVLLSKDEPRLSAAIKILEQVVRDHPDQLQMHNSLAIALAKAGRTQAAQHHFQEAVRLGPTDADSNYNLGFLLVQQREFEQAVGPLRQAVRSMPGLLKAQAQLAMALSATGDSEGAIHHFREAWRLAPDQPDGPFNLGLALMRADRDAEAVAPFSAAVRLDPDWLDARCELGRALIGSDRVKEGTEQLREVLRADPRHARARQLLESVEAPTSRGTAPQP